MLSKRKATRSTMILHIIVSFIHTISEATCCFTCIYFDLFDFIMTLMGLLDFCDPAGNNHFHFVI